MAEGAFLSIHDPKVDPKQITLDLGSEPIKKSQNSKKNLDFASNEGRWQFSDNISDNLFGADAAVLLTEWDIYAKIDWKSISQSMRNPAWVFDSRSIVNFQEIQNASLNFWRVGDGSIE